MLPGAYSRSPDLPLPSFQKKKRNKTKNKKTTKDQEANVGYLLFKPLKLPFKLPLNFLSRFREKCKKAPKTLFHSFLSSGYFWRRLSAGRYHTKLAIYIYPTLSRPCMRTGYTWTPLLTQGHTRSSVQAHTHARTRIYMSVSIEIFMSDPLKHWDDYAHTRREDSNYITILKMALS